MLRGLRGASALRALRSTSRYASTSKLIETELSPSGVLTISFHNEKKLNAWTQSLMKQMAAEISAADTRDDVRGVVLTGGGAYYYAAAGDDVRGPRARYRLFFETPSWAPRAGPCLLLLHGHG